jgi:hypothetical protein
MNSSAKVPCPVSESIWTGAFWKAAAERAIRAFCYSLLAVLGASATDLFEADWRGALGAAGMVAVLSLLGSVATNTVQKSGPGLTEVPSPPAVKP